MSAKFTFYQEVKVLNLEKSGEYCGLLGTVLGIGDDEGFGYSYAVYFHDIGAVSFDEDELKATGNFFKREDFYNGSYARVSQDGELLELHLVDKETNKSSDNEQ